MQVLIGLVIAAGVIYLYVMAILWFFRSLGTDILLFFSLAGTAAVPIVYGRAVWKVFSRDGWRALATVPLAYLLFLLYGDLAWLTYQTIAGVVALESGTTHGLLRVGVNTQGAGS